MADIGQAPGELAKLQSFVNTLDVEKRTDELGTPAELDRWLHEAGLAPVARPGAAGPRSGPRELGMALDLREALRLVLLGHVTHWAAGGALADSTPADGQSPADGQARLARIAASMQAGLVARADGGVGLAPAGIGSRAALTRLLLIAADATTSGTWTRLKACSADDCRWAFYDRSPTRNGCWCSMQVCGSRAKSRAYRRRSARER